MGAFFLYKTGVPINRKAVDDLFRAKGFSAPDVRVFGEWTLLSFAKQLLLEVPCVLHRAERSVCVFGTFAYRGLGATASLGALADDFEAGRLDASALAGASCVLFCTPKRITILTDRMNLFHVFTNDDESAFSSSFAALLKARCGAYKLNDAAAVENALTGYIIGPETIVHGVHLADTRYRQKRRLREVGFVEHRPDARCEAPAAGGSLSRCVDEQLAELDRYFTQFKALAGEAGGVDIGLSGGYDSRVLVLMARRHFEKVYAHSHFHRATTADETCAGKIAGALGVPLYLCSEAKQPADMDVEEFERNLENTAAYNDGRVIHDYSWLVYFRTRWYREAVLRDLRFGMNGLGGELYRNHDNHGFPAAETRAWLKARVLGVGASQALRGRALDAVLDQLTAKAGAALGADLSRRITHHQTRRYFGELFSVYGAAVRMNIDSQLAYSLSPFLDAGPRLASYGALPHLGLDGRFEAEMIRRLSPALAAITSTYGYPFDRRPPLSRLAKCALRGWVPLAAQNALNAARRRELGAPSAAYQRVCAQQPLVRRAVELMRSPRFGFDWDAATRDEILIMRILSVGIMLLKYEDCIDFS